MSAFMNRYGFTRASLLRFVFITANAELIYMFWNLRTSLTTPLMAAFGIDKAQLGVIAGLQGFIMLFLTIPLGWAGDRFKTHHVMIISSVVSGAVAIVLALMVPVSPSGFWIVVGGYGLMLVFTEAIYKTTNFKAISMTTDDTHQAAVFGLFEMGRGVITFIEGALSLAIFQWMGSAIAGHEVAAMRWTMIISAGITLLSALLVFFAFPRSARIRARTTGDKQEAFTVKDLLGALRIPDVWITGLSASCAYGVFVMCATLLNTYLVDVYGLPAVMAGSMGLIISAARIVAPGAAGQLADRRFRSSAHLFWILFAIMAAMLFLEVLLPKPQAPTPTNFGLLVPAFVVIFTAAFCCYMIRGIYYSPIGEAGIPSRVRASAMSAATTIGYTPALYGTYWFGSIIDRNEAAGDIVRGYNIVFMILGVYAVLGVVFALVLRRRWDARARAARKDAVKEEVSAS